MCKKYVVLGSMMLALWSGFLLFPTKVLGQYYSQSESEKTAIVDKKIKLGSGYRDNVLKEEKIYVDGEVLEFKIVIENNGNENLNDVEVTDRLPAYSQVLFNPGIYDKLAKTVSWTIDSLGVGQTKVYIIRGRVFGVNIGPKIAKMTNVVEIRKGDIFDRDTTSYYIGGKSAPVTGLDPLGGTMIAVMSVGMAFVLRKATRGYC